MDAFYASVEQRDHPELRGRPVAVGGSHRRGVVAAASYEARAFGIHSAMPSRLAAELCRDLVFVKPRFEVYKEVSQDVLSILRRYTSLVEPLSLDEAYLDVTQPLKGPPSATLIARAIRSEIWEETGLTASAGVSYNKLLAKLASDVDKPDGLTIVTPDDTPSFLATLPIGAFPGVGPVTESKFTDLGIHQCQDLLPYSQDELVRRFGKRGEVFFRMVRGHDERPLKTHRRRKSIGSEKTFQSDLRTRSEMEAALADLAKRVVERMAKYNRFGHCVTVKARYPNFETQTRQTTTQFAVEGAADLHRVACNLLSALLPRTRPVRLLGISVSKLNHPELVAGRQLRIRFPKDTLEMKNDIKTLRTTSD